MSRVASIVVLALTAGVSAAQPFDEDGLLAANASDRVSRSAADLILEFYDQESVLLIGELHGTVETPALVGHVIRRLSESQPVTLGLEISRQEQPRIDEFLESDGANDALTELLAVDYWRTSANGSDGRRSEAVVAMLESIRGLRADGKRVRVVALDDNDFFDADFDRRDGMARAIEELDPDLQSGLVIVLIGNFHARLSTFTGRLLSDGVPIDPIVPTASRVSGVPLTSINVTACNGGFWGCMNGTCGPQELPVQ
jgi:uncharacterized iron-regulated protein